MKKLLVLALFLPSLASAQILPSGPVVVNDESETAGTIATGGTTQTALAASTARHGCQVINTSTSLEFVGASNPPLAPLAAATTAAGFGGAFNCNLTSGFVTQQQINIESATTGATYVVISW